MYERTLLTALLLGPPSVKGQSHLTSRPSPTTYYGTTSTTGTPSYHSYGTTRYSSMGITGASTALAVWAAAAAAGGAKKRGGPISSPSAVGSRAWNL